MTSVALSSCSSDDDDDSNTTNNVVEKSYTSFDSIPWNRKSDSISVKAGNKIAYNYGRGTSYGVIEVKSAEAGKVSLVFYSDIAATHKVGAATLTDTEIYIDTTYTSLTEEKAIKNEEFILMTLKYQSTTLEAASYAMQALIAMDATSLSFYKLK